MAKPSYPEEDSMKYYKPKAPTHNKAKKGLSFFVPIFSLFVYISIFYIFNVSPYNLFNSNIFWLFMSNTLILIIAADYGSFSSANEKQHLYEEYVKLSQQARNSVASVPLHVPIYEQVDESCIINPKQELGRQRLQKNKETITHESEIPERVLEIVLNETDKPKSFSEKKPPSPPLLPFQVHDRKACDEVVRIPARTYRRSKSDRPDRRKHVVIDESKNSVMRRSETMKVEESRSVEEENEFSGMTNEELNKRVEDFIQRFNRQIRLQAARNVHQI